MFYLKSLTYHHIQGGVELPVLLRLPHAREPGNGQIGPLGSNKDLNNSI